jgi:hypothetical protein
LNTIDKPSALAPVIPRGDLSYFKGLDAFALRLRRELLDREKRPLSFLSSQDQAEPLFDDGHFNALALELMRLQFQTNPVYLKFCEQKSRRDAGGPSANPGGITHWSEIPVLPVSAFKEMEVSSISSSERTTVFHSSGTTGQRPSRHFHHEKSLALYEASLLAFFKARVISRGSKSNSQTNMLLLTPNGENAPNSSLAHMFETVRRQYGTDDSVFVGRVSNDMGWDLDITSAISILEKASASKEPLAVMGTAFSFVHLIDALMMQRSQFRLPPGSLAMETGGYKGRSRSLPKRELHRLIHEHLGIPEEQIVCEYGMSELSSQAYACGVEGLGSRFGGVDANAGTFGFPPWARARIVSPETGREVHEGQTGLIQIFDLANVYSALAIQTEDLGVRRGNGFELVGRATHAERRGCSLMAV